MKPLVSVVIPAFNSQSSLKSSLESVLLQTWKDLEIIVIDDCSTDHTFEVAKNFKNENPSLKFTILRLDKNIGPATCRNIGISKATGEWIAFLDSDDTWAPEKTQTQLEYAQKFNASFISCDTTSRDQNFQSLDSASQLSIMHLIYKNHFTTPSVLIKKTPELYFDPEMRFSEDFELWLRMIKIHGYAIKIHKPLVRLGNKPFHGSGLSSRLYEMELGELRAIWNHHGFFVPFAMLISILKYVRRHYLRAIGLNQ